MIAEQDFVNTVLNGSSGHTLTVNGTSGTHSTQIADSGTTLLDAGYLDVPESGGAPKTSNYAPALVDRGKMIVYNGSSLTCVIPANGSVAFPVGTTISLLNIAATGVAISITTDVLTWLPSGGTGARTLAQWGIATLYKYDSTHWTISGSGLT